MCLHLNHTHLRNNSVLYCMQATSGNEVMVPVDKSICGLKYVLHYVCWTLLGSFAHITLFFQAESDEVRNRGYITLLEEEQCDIEFNTGNENSSV